MLLGAATRLHLTCRLKMLTLPTLSLIRELTVNKVHSPYLISIALLPPSCSRKIPDQEKGLIASENTRIGVQGLRLFMARVQVQETRVLEMLKMGE
jgi:hypothetical protein